MSGIIGGVGSKSGVIGDNPIGTVPCFQGLVTATTNFDASVIRYMGGTEVFDVGDNTAFNASGGTLGTHGIIFTAPVTGYYQLNFSILVGNVDVAASYIRIAIYTGNRTYWSTITSLVQYDADIFYEWFTISVVADMDVNDIASGLVFQSGGAAQADGLGDSQFSGFLVSTT